MEDGDSSFQEEEEEEENYVSTQQMIDASQVTLSPVQNTTPSLQVS